MIPPFFMASLLKNFKNFQKTFAKPIDTPHNVWYNIDTTKGEHPEERKGNRKMKERKMSRQAIETAIKEVVEYYGEYYIGTAGINIANGAIISKIDTAITEMGFAEKAETKCFDGNWYIVRKHH